MKAMAMAMAMAMAFAPSASLSWRASSSSSFPLGPLLLSSSSSHHAGDFPQNGSRISCCCSSSSSSDGRRSILPARDVTIDFGKFKGSKMGTLPSSYLKWLVREVSDTRFDVWAKYAEQVLEDPYYRDRLEWESIEKLSSKGGDMKKKGGALLGGAGDAGVKGSMKALGWNLLDRDGWDKVNFSLLGTTLGGRIPRVEGAENPKKSLPSSSSVPEGSEIRKKASPRLAHSASKMRTSSQQQQQQQDKKKKMGISNELEGSSMEKKASEPKISLREELLRRRLLRKKIVQPRFSSLSLNDSTGAYGLSQFPGRDAFLKKIQEQKDK